MSEPRILVVDDEPDMVENCTRILRRAGYRVLGTTDPERALAMVESDRPDVLLMDLKMEPLDGMELMRRAHEIDPTLPVDNLMTLRRQARETVCVDRLVTILSLSFAALATLLAAIGLYGVMAYSVAQRKRELGLRLALGAEPANMRAMVLKQVGTMTLLGVAIGLIVAVASGRTVEALLYGVSSRSPAVLVGAAGMLAVVVLVASYGPARRASGTTGETDAPAAARTRAGHSLRPARAWPEIRPCAAGRHGCAGSWQACGYRGSAARLP